MDERHHPDGTEKKKEMRIADEVIADDAVDALSKRICSESGLLREMENCPRCGEAHCVKFITLGNPLPKLADYHWFSICPVKGEPILMRDEN